MEKYTPPFELTNEILNLVSSISEKLGKISAVSGLDSKPHLRKNSRIESIHSSLKIEANSLTLNQVRDVIGGKTVLGERREIQEVKNAYEAYDKLPEINPFDIKDLLKIHGIMTKQLVAESGVFRSGEEGVFSGGKCIFMAPPARLVPSLMTDLFDWLKRSEKNVHPLILSAVFHYEFVFIHPFSDGNGRMARLWHTAFLAKWNRIFEYIPIESQIEKFQGEYYEAISGCHTNGNSNLFIQFMLKQIDSILGSIRLEGNKENTEISMYVKKLLNVMDCDKPYTSEELMQALSLKSKESFRKHYMHPALSANFVQMTLPDKPKSKNQKYIKIRK